MSIVGVVVPSEATCALNVMKLVRELFRGSQLLQSFSLTVRRWAVVTSAANETIATGKFPVLALNLSCFNVQKGNISREGLLRTKGQDKDTRT